MINQSYEAYDYYLGKAIAKRPVCARCGEHIIDEYMYRINDEWLCEECKLAYLRDNRKNVIDYMEANR